MWNLLLDFLFPRRSLSGTEGEWITDEERRQLRAKPIVLEAPMLCSRGIVAIDRIVVAAMYDDAPLLKKAIHTFKYRRMRSLAPEIGRLLTEASRVRWTDGAPVLCPVPLHWTRRFQRGFNQADLLAEIVGSTRRVPVQSLLRRVRLTGHQTQRTREERLVAVRDAFRVSVQNVPPFVVLIDDVTTTGATLDACAAALKRAGATRVEGLVAAYG
ncbi:ComF family protein [Candidatus Peregrinibacteria bacterium]|nr:ComF family protein [Candidatus Peregrinibacteria bacterium]MBI3816913.1 ComF family protein [Candidatus Peregrinibacteria bacterium]